MTPDLKHIIKNENIMKARHEFESDEAYKQYLVIYVATRAMQSMIAGDAAKMVADRDGRYDGTNWKTVVALNAVEFADELIKQILNKWKHP